MVLNLPSSLTNLGEGPPQKTNLYVNETKRVTALSLIFHRGDSVMFPPIHPRWNSVYIDIIITGTQVGLTNPVKSNEVATLRVGMGFPKLMVSHGSKLVYLQLVSQVHLVFLVNISYVVLEYIEPLGASIGHFVVFSPPVVQPLESLLRFEFLLMVIEAFHNS